MVRAIAFVERIMASEMPISRIKVKSSRQECPLDGLVYRNRPYSIFSTTFP